MNSKHKLLTTALGLALFSTTHLGVARADDNAKPATKADPKAYELLKKAFEARQTIPDDFPGFDAEVAYQEGNKTATGTIKYRHLKKSTVEISGLPEEDLKWVKRQVISIITHRNSGDFNDSEGKFPLRFAKSEETEFGTLVEYDDPEKLTSRVKDNVSMELTRTAGEKRFFISVLENTPCDPGKVIPTRYLVSYFDPKTRELQMVNVFENSYAKFDKYWLPTSRKVVTIDHVLGDGLRVRNFQFKNIKLVGKDQ